MRDERKTDAEKWFAFMWNERRAKSHFHLIIGIPMTFADNGGCDWMPFLVYNFGKIIIIHSSILPYSAMPANVLAPSYCCSHSIQNENNETLLDYVEIFKERCPKTWSYEAPMDFEEDKFKRGTHS